MTVRSFKLAGYLGGIAYGVTGCFNGNMQFISNSQQLALSSASVGSTAATTPVTPVILLDAKNIQANAQNSLVSWNDSISSSILSLYYGSGSQISFFSSPTNNADLPPSLSPAANFNGSGCLVSNAVSAFPNSSDFTTILVVRPNSHSSQYLLGDTQAYSGLATYGKFQLSFWSLYDQSSLVTANSPSPLIQPYRGLATNNTPNQLYVVRNTVYGVVTNPNLFTTQNITPSAENGYARANPRRYPGSGYPSGQSIEQTIPYGVNDVIWSRQPITIGSYLTISLTHHRNLATDSNHLASIQESLFINGQNQTAMPYDVLTSHTDQYGVRILEPVDSVTYASANGDPMAIDYTDTAFTVGCALTGGGMSAQMLGHDGGGSQIAEIQIYNSALTDVQRSTVEVSLQAKYGHY